MPGRLAKRKRIGQLLRARPDLGSALSAVHSGPWSYPAQMFSPDVLTTLALA